MIDQQTPNTRDRIVEAARELFFEQGYHATGIAQILKRAEAHSGSLYYFFPTKEDLLVAVLEKYKVMLNPAVIEPAFLRVQDPVERVFAVLQGYRILLEATNFRLGCPIGNLALEIANAYPAPRALLVENFDNWCAALAGELRSSLARLPEETDPEALATYILAVMEGAVMLARTYQSFEPFDRAVQGLRDHFDRLVADGSDWSTPKQLTETNS